MAIVFTGQTVFAYLPEKNIWEERSRLKNTQVFARLSANSQTPYKSTPITTPDPSAIIQKKNRLFHSSNLLPANAIKFVRLKSANLRAKTPPVYLIEDVHLNEEAQQNTAAFLKTFLESSPRNNVRLGAEGSVGNFNFTDYPTSSKVTLLS
jgi:hypothetical protein